MKRRLWTMSAVLVFCGFFYTTLVASEGRSRPQLGVGETNAQPKASSAGGLSTTDLTVLTPDDLAAALLGGGVSISNVTYTGAAVAGGTFSGGSEIMICDNGIVLSTGNIASVVGPNLADGTTTVNGLPGDPDLDTLIPGFSTNDATVLEFDFECEGVDSLVFQYVLTSEEYNEFVETEFNDVFGFFLDGVNIALVPGVGISVAINNVNGGNPFSCGDGLDNDGDGPIDGADGDCIVPGDNIVGEDNSNSNLYINNDCDDPDGVAACTVNTEMDGLTVVLTATAPLTPGMHHIKLAVADAGDFQLDSNVFICGGTFTCALPTGACCDTSDFTCTGGVLEADCQGAGLVFSPGLACADLDPPCLPEVEPILKYSQPPHGTSDCCIANGTPGCDDPECQAIVCEIDPFCCDTAWDGICAGEAEDLCDICAGFNVASDLDWQTLAKQPPGEPGPGPNWVVADDFISNGKPVTRVRWWGSYLDPAFEPGNDGECVAGSCGTFEFGCGGDLSCVCVALSDGTSVCHMDWTCTNIDCVAGDCPAGMHCVLDSCCDLGQPTCAPDSALCGAPPPLAGPLPLGYETGLGGIPADRSGLAAPVSGPAGGSVVAQETPGLGWSTWTPGARIPASSPSNVESAGGGHRTAKGEVSTFTDQAAFETFVMGQGKLLKGLEDFEPPVSNLGPGDLATLVDPLVAGVPNTDPTNGLGFPNGLSNTNLAIQSNITTINAPVIAPGTGLVALGPDFIAPGSPNSVKVGADTFAESTDLIFDPLEAHTAVGFTVEDPINGTAHIAAFNLSNVEIFRGEFVVPGDGNKFFFGIWSPQPIGRINVGGAGGELVDDIQMWLAPSCPGEGDCFNPNATPGCEDPSCCETVCAAAPGCCSGPWNLECVALAFDLCAGTDIDGWVVGFHTDPGDENGVLPHPDLLLGLYFCPAELVSVAPTAILGWDGHQVYEYNADLEDCCLLHSNPDPRRVSNCCFAHPTPGCDKSLCEQIVCDIAPSCCDGPWTPLCADLAGDQPACLCGDEFPAQPGSFNENAGFVYWLNVQAVVGHTFEKQPGFCEGCDCDVNGDGTCDLADEATLIDCLGTPGCPDINCDGGSNAADLDSWSCLAAGNPPGICCQIVDLCIEVETPNRADDHFWGWHTSPVECLGNSTMGSVVMGPDGEWIYPEWVPVDGSPHDLLRVDQAFQLFTTVETCIWDLSGDRLVDAFDLAQLLGSWGPYGSCASFKPMDFNEDFTVDAFDLAQLLGRWGECPCEIDEDCDDTDACTVDVCFNESCLHFPIDCDDNDLCTLDSCDPAIGCVYAVVDCEDGDECTSDFCDPATGECDSDPIVPCCGNGIVEPPEECDPPDGVTCGPDCLLLGACGAGAGDCCAAGGNGTPGCDDPDCCACICAQDPFCCDISWDGICAGDAAEPAGPCPTECAECQG